MTYFSVSKKLVVYPFCIQNIQLTAITKRTLKIHISKYCRRVARSGFIKWIVWIDIREDKFQCSISNFQIILNLQNQFPQNIID